MRYIAEGEPLDLPRTARLPSSRRATSTSTLSLSLSVAQSKSTSETTRQQPFQLLT